MNRKIRVMRKIEEIVPHTCGICRKDVACYTIAVDSGQVPFVICPRCAAAGARSHNYVSQNHELLSEDGYSGAGLFTIEEAARVVLRWPYGVISPDASGKWLVMVVPEIGME